MAVPLAKLNLQNSSPLVLKAKEYLQNDHEFKPTDQIFPTWSVLNEPVF